MNLVKINELMIGEGKPKIAVPIVGKTIADIIQEAETLQTLPCDIVEWRLDLFDEVENYQLVADVSHRLHALLPGKPLLLTFRTLQEGGGRAFEAAAYYELYRQIIENGKADMLDLELFMADGQGAQIIKEVKAKGICIIMSNHDFEQTPSQTDISHRLLLMAEKQADICKIAVMPQSPADVLTLLAATNEVRQKTDRPIVTMSMGQLGLVSRIFGEIFGSAITFGAAEKSSAPGQLPVGRLVELLETASWQG